MPAVLAGKCALDGPSGHILFGNVIGTLNSWNSMGTATLPMSEGEDGATSPVRLICLLCVTRPHHEKKFAALLAAQRIEHYLPLIGSVRRYGPREVRFTKPLFPGYVFARVETERKGRVINHDHLARAIVIEDEAKFLRQLEDVRRIVASGLELSLHPLVQCGARVRVVSGPLRGLEGVVADSADAKGIVFAVDFIQHALLVKMPLDDLRPLP